MKSTTFREANLTVPPPQVAELKKTSSFFSFATLCESICQGLVMRSIRVLIPVIVHQSAIPLKFVQGSLIKVLPYGRLQPGRLGLTQVW